MRVSVKNQYDEAFREEALALLERSARSLPQVAADLGIGPSTLRYWYNSAVAKKGKKRPARERVPMVEDPSKETAEAKVARLERENERLRKENEELKGDREILKKAAAFFAKESE
jgi:transposase